MATIKGKRLVEVLLSGAELSGVPEKALLKSRNLITVDLIWPRAGIARKSASRQASFSKGKADFSSEEWAKRILFREEVEGHTALAVAISEPVSVQKARRFLQLVAKFAIKEGADIIDGLCLNYGDIARAPADALAQMVGEKDAPKTIAQGVIDIEELPMSGEEKEVTVKLTRPKFKRQIGELRMVIRG